MPTINLEQFVAGSKKLTEDRDKTMAEKGYIRVGDKYQLDPDVQNAKELQMYNAKKQIDQGYDTKSTGLSKDVAEAKQNLILSQEEDANGIYPADRKGWSWDRAWNYVKDLHPEMSDAEIDQKLEASRFKPETKTADNTNNSTPTTNNDGSGLKNVMKNSIYGKFYTKWLNTFIIPKS